MFASSDRLTFCLKNPTLFSRKVGNLSDFLPILFKAFCTFILSHRFDHPVLKGFLSAIFQRFFALKSAMRLFLQPRYVTEIIMQLACLIILSTQKDLCSERIFSNDSSADRLPRFKAVFSDDFSADRPTHFLGLEMTGTQLITD